MTKCEHVGCKKHPNFNYQGQIRSRFCAEHKLENMIDIKNKQCEHIGCKTRPNFNYQGQTNSRFCAEHKLENMIDVKHKQCEHAGCKKQPIYNYEGQTKSRFCAEHKLENMSDVKSKSCEHTGCRTHPHFNYQGQTKSRFCVEHKLENMINVISRRCEHARCQKYPIYNYQEQIRSRFCAEHKLENMIDVQHKPCKHIGCKTRAYYGIPGNSPTHCTAHKQSNQIANPKTKCNKCNEIAIYALNQKKAVHCEQHKETGEINIIERNCTKCNLPNILNQQSICTYCDPKHFNQFRLGKQLQVKAWLDANDFKYISYDSAINYKSCGDKERPDFVFATSSHYIVLEVDENQHNGRNDVCECTRMVNISQSLGMPTLFIRFNPDHYKIGKKKYDPSFNNRMKLLNLVLKTSLKLSVDSLPGYCAVKHLYFDNFSETAIVWNVITKFE